MGRFREVRFTFNPTKDYRTTPVTWVEFFVEIGPIQVKSLEITNDLVAFFPHLGTMHPSDATDLSQK